MARTFEAIRKSKEISAENIGSSSYLSPWYTLNFSQKNSLINILSKIGIEDNSHVKHTFHFASTRAGEGTSTILVNLAHLLINGSSLKNVLFIDGNLESPVFHLAFNLPIAPGFCEVFKKKANFSQAVHRIESSSVYIMPSGNTAISSSIGLESASIVDFVRALHKKFEIIIFDSPPLLSSPISLLWANAADVSFMVIQANRTQWEVAQKAQMLLEKNECEIGGVILNKVKYSIPEWLYKRL